MCVYLDLFFYHILLMSSLKSIEKTIFSDFHRSFNKLLFTLSKQESISQACLVDILMMNQNINKIIRNIDTINYKLLKKNSNTNKSLTKKQKEYLEDYEKETQIINTIKPYMLYMYMNL